MNEHEINSFTGTWAFLSNFYASVVMVDGFRYTTLEHAYQAAKTRDEGERDAIRRAPTPGQAKRIGRDAVLRKDWEVIKDGVMMRLLRIKFSNPWLSEHLMETENRVLVEGNSWHDNCWGDCWCSACALKFGENRLGKLLMELRAEIRNDQIATKEIPV